jgi:hypothetical protein
MTAISSSNGVEPIPENISSAATITIQEPETPCT